MAEPIVRELMRADRVDPAAFEALLRWVAARSPGRTTRPGPRRRRPALIRGQILAESLVLAKDVWRITKARFLHLSR
jgi:hypothetical protein